MNNPLRGVRRKVAAVAAIALVASLSQVAPTSASNPARGTRGGNLTVGVFNTLTAFCFDNPTNSTLGINQSVYEGLVEQRSDGRLVPYLAQSITPSNNFQTWTIKLRSGIKFHDGTDLDATAAANSFDAIRGAYFLRTGARHTLGSGVPFSANTRGVTVISSDTFRIDLWSPQVDYLESLYGSGRFFMRAPSDLTNATQCVTAGKGTGPFMFESITPSEVKLVRNPNYWRKDAAGVQLPYLDSITFKYVQQPDQRVNGLRSGTLDGAFFTSAGEVKQIVNVRKNKNLQTISTPDDYYPTIWLNNAVEPFNNKNARLAVAHAFDVESFYRQRNCFQGTCVGRIPTSVVGPSNVMHNKAGFIKFNLAKAREYAAAYKTDTGKDLSFTIPSDSNREAKANAEALRRLMTRAGISTSILEEDTSTQVRKAFPTPGTSAGNPYPFYAVLLFEGRGTGFILPFLQSNTFAHPGNLSLASAAGPTFFRPFGSLINVGRSSDATQDNLVWTARADTTNARNTKMKAITKYIQENAQVVALPTQFYMYAFGPKVKGYDRYTLAAGGQGRPMTNGGVRWTQVYIQK